MNKKNISIGLISAVSLLAGCFDKAPQQATAETPAVVETQTPTSLALANWLVGLTENHILPSYQQLANDALALQQGANQLCQASNPTQQQLVDVQQQWINTNHSWQAIQWLKVGPVSDKSRQFRLQFWPDSGRKVSKGIAKLLASKKPISAESIAGKSVATQGLPALEQLLFTAQQNSLLQSSLSPSNDRQRRCQLLVALAENVRDITTDIDRQWRSSDNGFAKVLIAGEAPFTNVQDAAEEVITNWIEHIEKLEDDKLRNSLAHRMPEQQLDAEFVLSNQSIPSIRVNLKAYLEIYTAGNGFGLDQLLIETIKQPQLAEQLRLAISEAQQLADQPASLALEQKQLLALAEKMLQIRTLLTGDFVDATEVSIGFNSNDGD